jgi:type IV pilus assembly protein PilB
MDTFRIDQDLFRSIPADLMLRYGFVPYRRDGKALSIVVSDPTDLPLIDELGVLLSSPIKVAVGPKSAIESILKKSENSQRVLEEATESFHLQLLKEEDNGWTPQSTQPSSDGRATSTSRRRTTPCT